MRDKIVQAMYDLTAPAHYPEEVADVVMGLLAEQPTVIVLQGAGRMNGTNFLSEVYTWPSADMPAGAYVLVKLR